HADLSHTRKMNVNEGPRYITVLYVYELILLVFVGAPDPFSLGRGKDLMVFHKLHLCVDHVGFPTDGEIPNRQFCTVKGHPRTQQEAPRAPLEGPRLVTA